MAATNFEAVGSKVIGEELNGWFALHDELFPSPSLYGT